MFEKIKKALTLYGLMLPADVKSALLEMGVEMDRLRAEVNQLRSELNEGKSK